MTVMLGAQRPSDSIIIDALRKKGYKATSQRIAICRMVLSSKEHPSIQRIYRDVKRLQPTVSLATVYKTLQVLREIHLIQELALVRSETRFDPNVRPHVNVVCLQCGSIRDVDDQIIRNVVSMVASRAKFTVTGQRFDIYGICEKCAKKKTTAT
jgi:Fur family peroxide stress response transcriptional regulator